MDAPLPIPPPHPPRPRAIAVKRGLAIVLLAGALALGGHTASSALRSVSVHPPPPDLPLVADATEAAARQREIAGTYATGSQSGDRIIVIHADGRVDFSELGAQAAVTADSDTYQLRRRDKRFSLITAHSGVIDIVNIDNVSYWRDAYRRR